MRNLFNYPFSEKELFTKRKSLRKELVENLNGKKTETLRIAVLGGSTTSDISQLIELFCLSEDYKVELYESDYNRFKEEILFDTKGLSKFSPDIIYLHTTIRNLDFTFKGPLNSAAELDDLVEKEFLEYAKLWKHIEDNFSSVIIQNNFELPLVRTLGTLESVVLQGKNVFVQKLNEKFSDYARKSGRLFLNDINYLSSLLGLTTWFDQSYWYNYKYPYGPMATPFVARSFVNTVLAIKGRSKKCLVLDLDNTMWGGVIGDDGLEGIQIGQGNSKGEAYLEFQKYVKDLSRRGILLAVCSKNDPDIAKTGFSHPDSYLKIEDFVSFYANWDSKVLNLEKIAKDLNIGLESIVFIDDNPAEREYVSKQLPMVAVPDVGTNVIHYPEILDRCGFFESGKLTSEDFEKITYYKNNLVRSKDEAAFENYEEFLLSLDMEAQFEPFNKTNSDRVLQLINKTNQFNLTTKRIASHEVETLIGDQSFITFGVRLKDVYGDNGLVSAFIAQYKDGNLYIDNWVMSCRVFKRNLEYAIFDKIISYCRMKNVTKIFGRYVPTSKNHFVQNLFEELTFEKLDSETWVIKDLDKYQPKNNVIRIID